MVGARGFPTPSHISFMLMISLFFAGLTITLSKGWCNFLTYMAYFLVNISTILRVIFILLITLAPLIGELKMFLSFAPPPCNLEVVHEIQVP